jgi:outer membrane lipoprotein carrier protein
MKKYLGIILYLCCTLLFAATDAEDLQAKLNAMRTMSAQFHQVVKVKKRLISTSSGSMALQRPGRFRWETRDPMQQLVVADGKKMWVYDTDLEQVSVKKQEKGLGGTVALFLSGYDDELTRDFNVKEKKEGALQVFDLTSKSTKENFQRIKLQFSQAELTGLVLYDQLGQTTSVSFSQIKNNPQLSARLFQFKPPKGVDVIRQ